MKKIHDCFNSHLQNLYDKAGFAEALNHKVSAFLPQALLGKIQVGSYLKGCLTLYVPANWASELRYFCPELRDKLRKEGELYALTTIKVKVANPSPLPSKTTAKKSKSLPTSAQKALATMVEDCDFLPLKEALQQLLKQED